MENLDEKIKEIQDYFRKKIVDGDYEMMIKPDAYSCVILVDGKYEFAIWLSNGATNVELYVDPAGHRFVIDIYFSEKEKSIIYNRIIGDGRLFEIARLKQRLKELGS